MKILFYIILYMELIKQNIEDILDIKGIKNNFINNEPFSEKYITLAQKWSKLPMYKDKKSIEKFFKLLNKCNVILLISGTGSGKTVLVPKFVLKYVMSIGLKGKIAVTNPKTLTTVYNAEYGAITLDIELGKEVGYKYRGSPSNAVSEQTRLIYCTDGLILATILGGDPLLKDYEGVIIDEAHERQINIDILLKLIKDLIKKRPDFKLIIMSATINATVFRDYFNTDDIKYGEMEVSGESNFEITQNWQSPKIKVDRSNYVDIAVDKIMEIINTTDTGDILVFVPITSDAVKGCTLLKTKCLTDLKTKTLTCDNIYCVEVFAQMKHDDKEMAVSKDLYKTKGFTRKVIFATNVAESSITFDGLVYVIETGYELGNYYDYKTNSYVVTKKYTSQAQIKQRIGRAGRTQAGVSYHLYSKTDYNKLELYPKPNIDVIDLTDNILSFFKYSKTLKNIITLVRGLISVPKVEHFITGLYKLHFINAIKLVRPKDFDEDKKATSNTKLLLSGKDIKWNSIHKYSELLKLMNGTITTIGYSILKFRSSPVISALTIIISYYMKCQPEIICIMAICEITDGKINSLFEYNKKYLKSVQSYFKDFIYNGSDHLTAYNIYTYLYLKDETKYLSRKKFKEIKNRIEQLEYNAKSITDTQYEYMKTKYNIIGKEPYSDIVKNIIYVLGLSHNYNLLKKTGKNKYKSLNYLTNSETILQYCDIINKNINEHNNVICNTLVNAFGKQSFQCITSIPNNIMSDLINYEKNLNIII